MYEKEIKIVGKEPKEKLSDCLNDFDVKTLKLLYQSVSGKEKKLKSKKEYINYLEKEIPKNFEFYLDDGISFAEYRILKTNNAEGVYDGDFATLGFMFHYHYDELDKDCINVIPVEIKAIFDEFLTKKREEQFLFGALKEIISGYLLATGFIPKKELKRIILNEKELNVTEKTFEKAIKEENIKTYKRYYTMVPNDLINEFEEIKASLPYKKIDIVDLENYKNTYYDLSMNIMSILGFDSIKEDSSVYANILYHISLSHSFLLDLPQDLKKEYKLDDEIVDEIEDIVLQNEYVLRFWDINGDTYENFKHDIYLEKCILNKKPSDNKIISCLNEMSEEGIKLLREYFSVKSKSLKKLEKVIEGNLQDDIDIYPLDYLFRIMISNNQEYHNNIIADLLFSGYIYLYSEDNKIKVLIPDETKKIIGDKLLNDDMIDVVDERDILINRYLKMNGVIRISKLVELLNDNHNLNITENEVIDILKYRGSNIINNEYASFVSNFPRREIEELMEIKDTYGKYRIVNLDEEDVEEEFLDEFDEYMLTIPKKDRETIGTNLFAPLFYGIYSKEILREILEEEGLKKYVNDLDNLVKKYKNRIGIWPLNGFTLNNKTIVSKKIGRNEPCPCGSGKKYKNCHGK